MLLSLSLDSSGYQTFGDSIVVESAVHRASTQYHLISPFAQSILSANRCTRHRYVIRPSRDVTRICIRIVFKHVQFSQHQHLSLALLLNFLVTLQNLVLRAGRGLDLCYPIPCSPKSFGPNSHFLFKFSGRF